VAFLAIGRGVDRVSGIAKRRYQLPVQVRIIFNNQQPHASPLPLCLNSAADATGSANATPLDLSTNADLYAISTAGRLDGEHLSTSGAGDSGRRGRTAQRECRGWHGSQKRQDNRGRHQFLHNVHNHTSPRFSCPHHEPVHMNQR